jgi:hypothetical protein
MTFDYTVAAAIARYEPVHSERLRDFAYAARQTWDELQLSKRDSISLQREIRNLRGEIDVLKSSLLEAEAAPQPVVPEAEALARMFHENYESLAEVAGYETRLETRSFNLESPNGRLMVLVCAEIRKELLSAGKETV